MSFYFPYNFYPVTGEITNNKGTNKPRYSFDYNNTKESDGNPTTALLARHDVWQKDKFSGYFQIKLKTITPLVIGNKHRKLGNHANSPTRVYPYKWNDKLAIPANSLRGMIATIAETLSQSTLRVLDEKYYPAFENIDTDLTPWKNDRVNLTPAELLFGVVDETGSDKTSDEPKPAKNLASRLCFTDATLNLGFNTPFLCDEPITLQQLASPRVVDAPELKDPNTEAYNHYFTFKATGEHVKQGDVWWQRYETNIRDFLPHGRKFYLSRIPARDYENTANTDNSKMKCTPIKYAQEFTFKIHFNNLSKAELTLIKTSIQPEKDFIHQIGLGKSLGLGVIELTIDSTHSKIINRMNHYDKNEWKNKGEERLNLDTLTDDTLIDKDTLTIIQFANNRNNLPESEDIRWRDGNPNGRDENSCSMPKITVALGHLPMVGEEMEANNSNKEKEITDEAKDFFKFLNKNS
jgi:CRISPR/Cas system CSM-associated protein Csm3 (group 7 of RAMP superfamily)